MKEISVHRNSAIIGLHKSILDDAEIACFIRDENGTSRVGVGFFGFVRSPLFDPVLCIVDDSRYEEALELLRPATLEGKCWVCPACSESIPGNFDECLGCAADAAKDA